MSTNPLQANYKYLAESIGDHVPLSTFLIQENVITDSESQEIFHPNKTTAKWNTDLLGVLKSKDWNLIEQKVIKAFQETGNGHCATILLKYLGKESVNNRDESTSSLRHREGTNTDNQSIHSSTTSTPSRDRRRNQNRILPHIPILYIVTFGSAIIAVVCIAYYVSTTEKPMFSPTKVNSVSGTSLEQHGVYLVEHLSDHISLKNHLLHENIISTPESENIFQRGKGVTEMNSDLLEVLKRKDWSRIEDKVIQIFRKTGNSHCAEALLENI